MTRARRAAVEAVGSALLLASVVGSGIMATRLTDDVALQLLANALATGAMLLALIAGFAPLSGAHFNPAVSIAAAAQRDLPWRDVPLYLIAQVAGAFAGVAAAHAMFDRPLLSASLTARRGAPQIFSELCATFGLVSIIWTCTRRRPGALPFAVAAYVTAAYWFTASTAFANPAVTLARAATDSFAGIRPADVPGFLAGQLAGAAAATLLCRWLVPRQEPA